MNYMKNGEIFKCYNTNVSIFTDSSYIEKEFAKYGWNITETKEKIHFNLDLDCVRGDSIMDYELDMLFLEFIAE